MNVSSGDDEHPYVPQPRIYVSSAEDEMKMPSNCKIRSMQYEVYMIN